MMVDYGRPLRHLKKKANQLFAAQKIPAVDVEKSYVTTDQILGMFRNKVA